MSAHGSESSFASSAQTDVPTSSYQSDFKRGKRFKRLLKLLGGKAAQLSVRRFQLHTYGVLAALLIIHIACFATLLSVVQQQGQ